MSEYIEPIERLADMFRKLSGIGKKTALRLSMSVLDFSESDVKDFSNALLSMKRDVKYCKECHNLSVTDYCDICSNDERDKSTICVVEDYKSVIAIEKTRKYNGVYHVLNGTISPLKKITPDKLTIDHLIKRVNAENVKEVIIATNPTVDGETTALYLYRVLQNDNITISRIANGVPVGGDLEYTDEITLQRSLEGRYKM